jgi:soluble lytic murein transglycosylase-like protein
VSDPSFSRARKRANGWNAIAKFSLFAVLTVVSAGALRIGAAPDRLPASHVSTTLAHFFARPAAEPSEYQKEAVMGSRALLDRWTPFIEEASRRFAIPGSWIRAVIARESGGRTMTDDNTPITSDAGAEGLMQVMPDTYDEMRIEYGLGANARDPHDNIVAGTAYMRWLYKRYGFPKMFAAYNDGPGNFDQHLEGKRALPAETVAYLAAIGTELAPAPRPHRKFHRFAANATARESLGG